MNPTADVGEEIKQNRANVKKAKNHFLAFAMGDFLWLMQQCYYSATICEARDYTCLQELKNSAVAGATNLWSEKIYPSDDAPLYARRCPMTSLKRLLVIYQNYVKALHEENNYDLSQIGNADETPIYFDMPTNYTVNVKGEKQVITTRTQATKNNESPLCSAGWSVYGNGETDSSKKEMNRKVYLY